MSTSTHVYLSAVSDEFKSYGDGLTHALTHRGFLVKRREDFVDNAKLLETIEEYIRKCEVVICLMGDAFGPEPDPDKALAFADISKSRHSFIQWEYLFGIHIGKTVFVFSPAPNAPRDHPNQEPADLKELQTAFRNSRIDPNNQGTIPFSNSESLCEEALATPVLTPPPLDPVIDENLNLENPYVGLRQFTEDDQDRFFGRDELINEIIAKIETTAVLALFGESGSGKSSVVRARVIPLFRAEYPEGIVVVFTPGRDPFGNLRNALQATGLPKNVVAKARQPSPFIFKSLRGRSPATAVPWLFFIDQFEEIFALAEKEDAPAIFQFVQSLIELAANPNRGMRVMIAIRDDFLGQLGNYPGLAGMVDQNLIRVRPPSWQEICQMIETPAANHGVQFESHLVSRIVSRVEGRSGMLPFLQYALRQLWETEKADQDQYSHGMVVDEAVERMGGLHDRRINLISYREIDGIEGALPQRLEHFFESKTSEERQAIRSILLSLIRIVETDSAITSVARTASRSSLIEAGGAEGEALVDQMLKQPLLSLSENGSDEDPVMGLSHQSLIRGWRRLENWVAESGEAFHLRKALEADAVIWDFKMKNNIPMLFDDLWGGPKLQRARKFSDVMRGATCSDFDRIGGIGSLARDFLIASEDRKAIETRDHLTASTNAWLAKKRKQREGSPAEELWTGPALHRALELNEMSEGATQSEFDRIGGLPRLERKFLKASHRATLPKSRIMPAALVAVSLFAVLAYFTPLKYQGPGTRSGEEAAQVDSSGWKAFFKKFLPGKE